MISIIICEDQKEERESLVKNINNYIMMEELDFKITGAYQSTDEILVRLSDMEKPCVYFLDVDLGKGQEGFQAAFKIREADPTAVIVFITSHKELMGNVFDMQLETMDYINKDKNMMERVKMVLHKAEVKYSYYSYRLDDTVSFQIGRTVFYLNRDEIFAVRTTNDTRKLEIDTVNGVRQCHGLLKDMTDKLGEKFMKCDRGCLVNRDLIAEYDKKNAVLIMKNGRKYQVSGGLKKYFG